MSLRSNQEKREENFNRKLRQNEEEMKAKICFLTLTLVCGYAINTYK